MSEVLHKLGWRAGMATRITGLPDDLRAAFAPALKAEGADPVWHLAFAPDAAALERIAAEDVPHYARGQHLWVAYPKKTSGVQTDIDRDHGWEPFAALDLHGVTQISLSPVWSALRFRYRDEIKRFTRKF